MDDLEALKFLSAARGLQDRELSAKERAKLESIRSELERKKNSPQCPACGGHLEGQFRKCMHCASDLVWVEGFPCEPGNETELLSKIKQRRRPENLKVVNGYECPNCGSYSNTCVNRDVKGIVVECNRCTECFINGLTA